MKLRWTAVVIVAICAAAVATDAWAAGTPGQGTWETSLQPRDLDNNGSADAFYDTALGITWLRDANVDIPGAGRPRAKVRADVALAWADQLVVGGYDDWRLPMMVDTGSPGCSFSEIGGTDCGWNVQTKEGDKVYSEWAYLWYAELGNKAHPCVEGPCPAQNTGPFVNMQMNEYWFGTFHGVDPDIYWVFWTGSGYQVYCVKSCVAYVLPVHPGDIGVPVVPEPSSYALLLTGMAALAWVGRRRSRSRRATTQDRNSPDRATARPAERLSIDPSHRSPHRQASVSAGLRLSRNAAMPSCWSAVPSSLD